MEHELTLEQAREVVLLCWRHRGAEVVVHAKSWGWIVEARRGRRALELLRFAVTGDIAPDTPVRRAA